MRWLNRYALRVAIAIAIYLAVSIARDVANVTTTRLYLSGRTDGAPASDASERFDIEGSRVVPQIAVRQRERIAFDIPTPWPSTLHVSVRPSGGSPYEIFWRDRGGQRLVARATSADAATVAAAIPAGPGMLELVAGGPLTWIDPRVVSGLRVTRRAILFLVCGAVALVAARYRPAGSIALPARHTAFKGIAVVAGGLLAAASLEVGLRALGNRAPAAILAQRHDLGEVRKDPRWEHTRRYGRRLRANVRETSEWRYGDIVRMGFVPAAATDGVVRRFPFQTDGEGFRNAQTRARIDVAALGDSFTDAMTLDESLAWPRLLEQQSGLVVQNYGTSGFGPQQELRVLTDYAVAHHPRIVVLAFFAGNDLFEAESFDDYERSSGAIRRPDPGWPIKNVVSLADTWVVPSALHATRRWIGNRGRAEAKTVETSDEPRSSSTGETTPTVDRGMFSIPVNGQMLRFAFMPPYLNTLRMSEQRLSRRKGWALTREALRAMRDATRAANAELVVMFLPFKSQIYVPVARASMPQDALSSALRYYLPDGGIDLDAMEQNRLAQNRMMQRFCNEAGIRFLDTTDALADRLQHGVNVYFPDDSHLNEAGQAVVATTVDRYLKALCGAALEGCDRQQTQG